jgi:hypothetical protein
VATVHEVAVQSLISFLVIGLGFARAVNVVS